ncbi:hypothetical protein QYM36_001432 [Artemia franciscana]|uniref:Uncharacterized protein n=1 Tax=Artemia franciscana TaxID=6661 RepID=A0AA88LIG4_ARTSF|nr:hypothetical protein QYM36_001432 [Artemia franciscana]
MVVPEEREGRTELNQDLMRDPRKASEQLGWGSSAGTRQGGGPEATEQPLVVVDMREFRSELPALIHRRGMDIYPITIEKKRPQPTPEAAASITSENQPEFSTERFNSSLHDFLLKLPGVTHKNVFALLNNVKNLAELCSLSQEEISELLKNSFQGKSLFDALHSPLTSESGASSSGKGSKRFGDKKGRWNTKKARS